MIIPNYEFIEACRAGNAELVDEVLGGKKTLSWPLTSVPLSALNYATEAKQDALSQHIIDYVFSHPQAMTSEAWTHGNLELFRRIFNGGAFGKEEQADAFLNQVIGHLHQENKTEELREILALSSLYKGSFEKICDHPAFQEQRLRISSFSVLIAFTPYAKKGFAVEKLNEHFKQVCQTLTPEEAVDAILLSHETGEKIEGLVSYIPKENVRYQQNTAKRRAQMQNKWTSVVLQKDGVFLEHMSDVFDRLPSEQKQFYKDHCQEFDAKFTKTLLEKNTTIPVLKKLKKRFL